MNVLLRLFCGILGCGLLLASTLPGIIAGFAAQAWYEEHITHTSDGHLFEIGIGSIWFTTEQALLACGGAAVVLFAAGLTACYLAVSRTRSDRD